MIYLFTGGSNGALYTINLHLQTCIVKWLNASPGDPLFF